MSRTKKSIPPNFWRLKSYGSLGNNDYSVGVVKVVMVENCVAKKNVTSSHLTQGGEVCG